VSLGLTGLHCALLRVTPVVPTWVPPDVPQSPVAIGPHRKNVTFPVGSGGLVPPDTVIVALSVTAWPGRTGLVTVSDAWVSSVGLHWGKCASTKSFRVAVVAVEERLSATMLEKHSPARPRVDRLRPAS